MAGDWIKVEHATPDKPEVGLIAEALGIDQDAAFGKLVRLWIWADQNMVDGNAPSVTFSLLDRYTHCVGFGQAVADAGWLELKNDKKRCLVIPKFERHNGESAKQRALTARRVAKKRNAVSVTSALPREEKRRVVRGEASYAASSEAAGVVVPNAPEVLSEGIPDGDQHVAQEGGGKKNSRCEPADVAAVLEHYRGLHPKARAGAKERALVAARLREGFSTAELCEAIDGCHRSPFHCGENERGRKYQTLGLIFRDAQHVQQFLEVQASQAVLSERERRGHRAVEQWVARNQPEVEDGRIGPQ